MLASEQLRTLWGLICSYKTQDQLDSESMGFYDWINRMSPSYLAKAYSTKGDLLEGGRTKCIHKRGLVALATFTSIETDYKFTGLYAENSPILIRISLKEHSETIYGLALLSNFLSITSPQKIYWPCLLALKILIPLRIATQPPFPSLAAQQYLLMASA